MAALTGQTIASSYEQILHVDNDGGGNSTTLVTVKDGDNGTTFALQLATDKVSTSGDLIIDADDKALVLGDDQDASIFSNAAGEIFFVRGQDYSPAAGDVEGWIAMTLGNSGDTYLNVMGGETGSAHLLLHSDGGDDDADKWKLTAVNDGGISFNYASTGSYVTHLKLDANSRISLSNNDGGSTSGVDSTTGNTIFGYLAGAAVDSDVINNTIFGHKAGNALNAGDGNTIIGSQTGDALTTGLNNTFIGREAGSATTDVDLAVCIGYGAGAAVMTGGGGADQTTAVGSSASASLTSGQANTAIGYSTLSTNQTSDFNTAIGHQSLQTLQVADLGRNTAVGINTLNALATGVENTVMGAFACDAMAVGESYNVAIGSDTMGAVDEGSGNANYNVAIGADALKGGDLGSNGDLIGNIAIGALALDATGTAAFTGAVAIGHQALTAQTADAQSVAIGYQAGLANQTGSKNVIIGYQAGITATDIDNAVLIGWKAGNAINANGGDATVAIGYEALNDLTSGEHNIAIGYKTLEHITTGTDNIAIGYQALGDKDHHSNCADSDHNLAIGTNALGGAWESNTSEYNVGVGNYTLDGVMNDANYNTAVGYAAGSAVTEGDDNSFFGKYAGVAVTDGEDNTLIGSDAGKAITTADANVCVGMNAGSNFDAEDGNVAIGRSAFSGAVNGAAYCVSIGMTSMQGAATQNGTVAIGYNSLNAVTSGQGNTGVGFQTLDSVVGGSHNTAVGYNALTTAAGNASHNTAVGRDALNNWNVDGDGNNTAVGSEAGVGLTTGVSCVLVGAEAGKAAQDVDGLVLIGDNAGKTLNNSNCDQTVGVGRDSLLSLTTGNGNVAVGAYTLDAMTVGDNNTALGASAGSAIDTSDGNDDNTFVGCAAALNATDASQTTLVGYSAGRWYGGGTSNNATGAMADCTLIGSQASASSNTPTNQIVIGETATGQADNSVTLGNASVDDVYMAQDSGATVHCLDVKPTGGALKENLLSNSGWDVWSNSNAVAFINDDVTNGDFGSDAASWTAGRGATVAQVSTDGGRLRVTNGGTTAGSAHQAASTVKGKWYRLKMDIKAASGVSNGYVRLATGAAGSGTMRIEHNAGVGDDHTRYYQAVATETVYVTCQVYSGSEGNYVEYDNVSFTQVVPSCTGSDSLAPDGWIKDGTLDLYRYENDGGTYSHDGAYYSLKWVPSAAGDYMNYPSSDRTSDPEWVQRFAGKTVTIGAWVHCATGSHFRVGFYDGSDRLSSYHGAGGWEWMEYTHTCGSSITAFCALFQSQQTSGDVYISQPIMVLGNSIGEGNYTRPKGEIITCEKHIGFTTYGNHGSGTSHSDVSVTTIDVEEDSNWKLPRTAKAFNIHTECQDSASAGTNVYMYFRRNSTSGATYWNRPYGKANDTFSNMLGWQNTDDGDFDIAIEASGSSTFDITAMDVSQVMLD